MHAESMALMEQALGRYTPLDYGTPIVLDVAAYDVNGTYRPLVEDRAWIYEGLDVRPGPNVDVVSQDPYNYPLADGFFDIVIYGNALHNTEKFWLVIDEMKRVTRSGGLIVVIAPTWNKPDSGKYPVDCWRVLPDGMNFLLDDLRDVEIETVGMDIMGSGFKP